MVLAFEMTALAAHSGMHPTLYFLLEKVLTQTRFVEKAKSPPADANTEIDQREGADEGNEDQERDGDQGCTQGLTGERDLPIGQFLGESIGTILIRQERFIDRREVFIRLVVEFVAAAVVVAAGVAASTP